MYPMMPRLSRHCLRFGWYLRPFVHDTTVIQIVSIIIKYTIHNITKFIADVFADDMCRSRRQLKRDRESQEETQETQTTASTWERHLIQSGWMDTSSNLRKKYMPFSIKILWNILHDKQFYIIDGQNTIIRTIQNKRRTTTRSCKLPHLV